MGARPFFKQFTGESGPPSSGGGKQAQAGDFAVAAAEEEIAAVEEIAAPTNISQLIEGPPLELAALVFVWYTKVSSANA